MEFSHVGLITDRPQPGEVFVEATRVWITDFVAHPYKIEWLRFEPDSPVTGPVRTSPHVAYKVPSIEQAATGFTTLIEPFTPLPNLRVGFYLSPDGAVLEFMEYAWRSPATVDGSLAETSVACAGSFAKLNNSAAGAGRSVRSLRIINRHGPCITHAKRYFCGSETS